MGWGGGLGGGFTASFWDPIVKTQPIAHRSVQRAMQARTAAHLTAATLEVDLMRRRVALDAAVAAGPAQFVKARRGGGGGGVRV